MKLGMEKWLREKLGKVKVGLKGKGKKVRGGGEGGDYIEEDEVEIDEDE